MKVKVNSCTFLVDVKARYHSRFFVQFELKVQYINLFTGFTEVPNNFGRSDDDMV